MSTYIACIGKTWGDAGLKNILVDSDIYAACTVEHMLNGKEFKQAFRALMMAYEALSSLYLQHFFIWSKENLDRGLDRSNDLHLQVTNIQNAVETRNQGLMLNAVNELQAILHETLNGALE